MNALISSTFLSQLILFHFVYGVVCIPSFSTPRDTSIWGGFGKSHSEVTPITHYGKHALGLALLYPPICNEVVSVSCILSPSYISVPFRVYTLWCTSASQYFVIECSIKPTALICLQLQTFHCIVTLSLVKSYCPSMA